VNRYILWSIVFHIAVVLGGALLAPMSGLVTSAPRSEMIISVGLVDAPNQGGAPGTTKDEPSIEEPAAAPPKLDAPEPALDADLAIKPIADLTKEKVAEPKPKEKPKKPAKDEPKEKTTPKEKADDKQLASADTAGVTYGAISEGAGSSGDVWGVEVGPGVSPYHNRGIAAIRSNWRSPAVGNKPIRCGVRFVVKKTGEIVDVEVETSSGSELFDRAAMRAVQMVETWEPFPSFLPYDEQVVILSFEYRP
jgi:TonB family protein